MAEAVIRRESADASERLIAAVTQLLVEHMQKERDRAVRLCRKRAETWRNTSSASGPATYAREEARARANEASYLADLLESGEELAPFVM